MSGGFHEGPAVELYDVLHGDTGPGPMRGDAEFYRRLARRTRGPILEVGCGTGRVSLPLARAGHEVVGLDLSPGMLAIARKKARDVGATASADVEHQTARRARRGGVGGSGRIEVGRVRFVRADMRRFALGRTFRLILIPFRSFQLLLTPADQKRCLVAVRRHLAPDGLFCVNLFNPQLVRYGSEQIWLARAAPAT